MKLLVIGFAAGAATGWLAYALAWRLSYLGEPD